VIVCVIGCVIVLSQPKPRQFFSGGPLKASGFTAKRMDSRSLISPSEYSETGHNDDLSVFTGENDGDGDKISCSCCGLFRIILKVFHK
jgi:hypothetical protein